MAERIMKNSNINWIGDVPFSWEIRKVKQGFYRKDSKANQENPTVLSLARSGVKVRDITKNEGQLAESYNDYNPVEPGDLLLNPMDLYSGANCSISNVSGVISPAYMNLKSKDGYNPNFYDYYFKTQYWGMAMFAHGKGVSFDNRWTMNRETLMNYYIPYPDFNEQNKIANFLDKKVSEIDNAIEKTKQSIEEYKKLKQSIITEAVTKGLNPEVEIRESGIEWIGNSPKHWKNYLMFQLFNQVKNKNTGMKEKNLLSLSYGNIIRKNINTTSGLLPENFEGYNIVEKDDIVLRLTDLQNDHKSLRTGLVKERGIITSAYLTLRNTSVNNPKYLRYYLHSFDISKGFYGMGDGVRQGLNWDELKTLKVCLPPIEEQNKIVNAIETKIEKYENLIKQKNMFVDELEQYKKSLIYEYVTGKKEVA